ncbi:MAG: hypothetical protein HY225_03605, partial [Candidatus Vogelbacteria bacterium]|nr:hypothetical protein [Candidatus Vogelbacteria bacterium]
SSGELSPKLWFVGDGGHVEDQYIGVIAESKRLVISFKLKDNKQWEEITKELLNHTDAVIGRMVLGSADFGNLSICPSVKIEIYPGVFVDISIPDLNDIRSFYGKVRILISKWPDGVGADMALDVKNVIEQVEEFCATKLKIDRSIFTEPGVEAVKESKIEQYAWSHKKKVEDLNDKELEVASNMVREEVAPGGYETWIEKGRAAEMEKQTPFFIYHDFFKVQSPEQIAERLIGIFAAGGLISSHERYERGSKVDGFSSMEDLRRGGGDGVFLRMMASPAYRMGSANFSWLGNPRIIFDTMEFQLTRSVI